MTGLIYNRPPNPIEFLEQSLQHIKKHPDHEVSWDMFIEKGITSSGKHECIKPLEAEEQLYNS